MDLRWLGVVTIVLGWVAGVSMAQSPATHPAEIDLTDLSGTVQHPLDLGTAKAAVVLFIATDCPISNGYAPEINRICRQYAPQGVRFYLVHVDPDLKAEDAAKHAADYGFSCPVLIDRRRELVRALSAKVTPQAVVLGPGAKVVYHGRIDNWYAQLGKPRTEATTHELRDALEAVLAGKPVAVDHSPAVGCAISD